MTSQGHTLMTYVIAYNFLDLNYHIRLIKYMERKFSYLPVSFISSITFFKNTILLLSHLLSCMGSAGLQLDRAV